MDKTLAMKKGGSPTKKTPEIEETLKTSIEENSSLTLVQASDIIFFKIQSKSLQQYHQELARRRIIFPEKSKDNCSKYEQTRK